MAGVSPSDESKVLSPNSTVPLSSTEHFSVFQLIVLVLQLSTSQFCFTYQTHFQMQQAAVFTTKHVQHQAADKVSECSI